MNVVFNSIAWWLGCAWAYYELRGHQALFSLVNLRWLRAGVSGAMLAATFSSFNSEVANVAATCVSCSPILYAASLRGQWPQRWMLVHPLLRTFVYALGFFTFFCVLIPHELFKVSEPLVFPNSKIWAATLLVCSCCLMFPCFLQFAKAGATPEPLDSPSCLLEGGWYAFCEHPIMYGEILAIFAGVAAFPSAWGFIYAAAISLIMRGWWAPLEEKHLRPKKLHFAN